MNTTSPPVSLFLLAKEILTDKYYLAAIALFGMLLYVIYYRIKSKAFDGLDYPSAVGAGTGCAGIFTGFGIVLLSAQPDTCKEFNDARLYIALGGVSAIWVGIQSVATKLKKIPSSVE